MTDGSLSTVRIGGVPEHFNLPWHLAIEAGDPARLGIALEWRDYSSGTGAMLAGLASGEIDLAVLLTEGAALGIGRGLPIDPVSLYTTSPLIWGIHVAPSSRYLRAADLEGARFAISREGSGSHLMSLALALEQDWPTGSLEFVIVDDLPGAVAAFREARADVFLWEHFTTQPAVDAGAFRRIGDFVSPWPAWTLCGRRGIPDAVRGALDSLLGQVALQARRLRASDTAAATIANRYGLEPEAVGRWLETTQWVHGPMPPAGALADARRMLDAAGAR